MKGSYWGDRILRCPHIGAAYDFAVIPAERIGNKN